MGFLKPGPKLNNYNYATLIRMVMLKKLVGRETVLLSVTITILNFRQRRRLFSFRQESFKTPCSPECTWKLEFV